MNPSAKSFVFTPAAAAAAPEPVVEAVPAVEEAEPVVAVAAPAPAPAPVAVVEVEEGGEEVVAAWDADAPEDTEEVAAPVVEEGEEGAEPVAVEAAPVVAVEAAPVVAVEAAPVVKVKTKKKKAPAVKKEQYDKRKFTKGKINASFDEREHLNIVFIGHVDAGKSTITGQLMKLTGNVDERTIAKYETEAKAKNRESWYLAYIMDTNTEERDKGKTVEVGRAHFQTKTKRYTLLDAPGHKNYVPNMIGGAAQADVGVLVISARRGEFEAGLDRGGQTREHAMLAKTLGIHTLVVLVNKMDEKTVLWSIERFNQIKDKMSNFLKKRGYNIKKDVVFLPCSGFTGANLLAKVTPEVCPWFEGNALIDILDGIEPQVRDTEAGARVPIITKFKDMGSVCLVGKLEAGVLSVGDDCLLMPTRKAVSVVGLSVDETEVTQAHAGENVLVKVKGCEEEDILSGFVLCEAKRPCAVSTTFEAQVLVQDLLPHKPIMTVGYQAIIHVHTAQVECTITKIVYEIVDVKAKAALQEKGKSKSKSKKSKSKAKAERPLTEKMKSKFIKAGARAVIRIKTAESIAVDTFAHNPSMARFMLRDEGETVLIGKILRIAKAKDTQQ